ncbi:MAG: hypothetical protein IPM51_08940 [Sphingobacteriaceae bacterium]|nr:hypothetical protein [Sphingobacteriaceae bacterium]
MKKIMSIIALLIMCNVSNAQISIGGLKNKLKTKNEKAENNTNKSENTTSENGQKSNPGNDATAEQINANKEAKKRIDEIKSELLKMEPKMGGLFPIVKEKKYPELYIESEKMIQGILPDNFDKTNNLLNEYINLSKQANDQWRFGNFNDISSYKAEYPNYIKRELIPVINQMIEYSDDSDLAVQYKCAKTAKNFYDGAVFISPGLPELVAIADKVNSNYNKILQKIPADAFQKEHFFKLLLFNQKITPGGESGLKYATTWENGKALYAAFYFPGKASYFLRGIQTSELGGKEGIPSTTFKLKFDNENINEIKIVIPVINKMEGDKPYGYYDLFPSIESMNEPKHSEYSEYFKELEKLPNGTYNVQFSIRSLGEYYSNSIRLVITDEAKEYFKKAREQANRRGLDQIRVKKGAYADANFTSIVNKEFKRDEFGTPLRTAVDGKWEVYKNGLGIPLKKSISIQVVYKDKNGKCFLYGGLITQTYDGKSYGKMFLDEAYNTVEMLCENANK